MFTCKVGENIINTIEYQDSDIRKWSNKGILKCPVCGNKMIYRNGKIKIAHFAHEGKCTLKYSEPETEEHLNGKRTLYEWLKKQDGIQNLMLESFVPETKQRPDIYFEQNDKRFVFEYQCSPIASQYLERHELYKLAGINDIWILGTEKYTGGKFIEQKAKFIYNSKENIFKTNTDNIFNVIEKDYLNTWTNYDINDFLFKNGKFKIKSESLSKYITHYDDYLLKVKETLTNKERIHDLIISLRTIYPNFHYKNISTGYNHDFGIEVINNENLKFCSNSPFCHDFVVFENGTNYICDYHYNNNSEDINIFCNYVYSNLILHFSNIHNLLDALIERYKRNINIFNVEVDKCNYTNNILSFNLFIVGYVLEDRVYKVKYSENTITINSHNFNDINNAFDFIIWDMANYIRKSKYRRD